MSIESAEITKLACNALLAQRISSINSLAILCDTCVNANINDIVKGIGNDVRIGSKYLQPGIGFGGSCLTKDISLLCESFESINLKLHSNYWNHIKIVNKFQHNHFIKILVKHIFDDNRIDDLSTNNTCIIAVYGITFKANTNDIRLSKSIKIINSLVKKGATNLKLFDPYISTKTNETRTTIPSQNKILNYSDILKLWNINKYNKISESDKQNMDNVIDISSNVYDAVKDTKYLIICTEWDIFRKLDYNEVFNLMQSNPIIFDGRYIVDRDKLENIGFKVVTI